MVFWRWTERLVLILSLVAWFPLGSLETNAFCFLPIVASSPLCTTLWLPKRRFRSNAPAIFPHHQLMNSTPKWTRNLRRIRKESWKRATISRGRSRRFSLHLLMGARRLCMSVGLACKYDCSLSWSDWAPQGQACRHLARRQPACKYM